MSPAATSTATGVPVASLYDPSLEAHVEESRNLNQLIEAFMAQVPSFADEAGLAELRANDGFFASGPVEGVVERTIAGPGGPIPARVIERDRVDAVYLDLHGGGWCIGRAASGDQANASLAEQAGVAVVSIDYRLAPEHPFPAGPDDCEAVATWLLEHAASEWGTDRLVIGGGSAGAHLAALTLVRLRDHLGPDAVARFLGANLVFGCYDLGFTPSARDSHDLLVIPRETLDACADAVLPGLDAEARRDPAWSPLFADLHGLPPALLTVGTLDPLLDDSVLMAEAWRAAGNVAELAVYPESVHGFPSFPTELGRLARERIAGWVADIVAGR